VVYEEAQLGRGKPAGVGALEEEQAQLINRRAVLLERKDSIAVDAFLADDAIEFSSPALFGVPSAGLDRGRAVGVGVVLGLLTTAAVLFFRATRVEAVTDKAEPAALLGAPLLASVPDFAHEALGTSLPIRDAPRSASAEAFRFAATSLEKALAGLPARGVLVTSSTVGHGKTVVAANVVLSVARRGLKVLAVDADFGSQELTSLLTGTIARRDIGITDFLLDEIPLDRAVSAIGQPTGGEVGLLSRGSQVATAVDVFRQAKARDMFQVAADSHDLVIVDGPPFLQVAYSATLASYIDCVLVVVRHGTPRRELVELAERLRFAGANIVGYIFNGGPLSDEMTNTGGSMRDVLGDLGYTTTQSPQRRRSEG
jgi:Mrp family chromosome partitioning ATPase